MRTRAWPRTPASERGRTSDVLVAVAASVSDANGSGDEFTVAPGAIRGSPGPRLELSRLTGGHGDGLLAAPPIGGDFVADPLVVELTVALRPRKASAGGQRR